MHLACPAHVLLWLQSYYDRLRHEAEAGEQQQQGDGRQPTSTPRVPNAQQRPQPGQGRPLKPLQLQCTAVEAAERAAAAATGSPVKPQPQLQGHRADRRPQTTGRGPAADSSAAGKGSGAAAGLHSAVQKQQAGAGAAGPSSAQAAEGVQRAVQEALQPRAAAEGAQAADEKVESGDGGAVGVQVTGRRKQARTPFAAEAAALEAVAGGAGGEVGFSHSRGTASSATA